MCTLLWSMGHLTKPRHQSTSACLISSEAKSCNHTNCAIHSPHLQLDQMLPNKPLVGSLIHFPQGLLRPSPSPSHLLVGIITACLCRRLLQMRSVLVNGITICPVGEARYQSHSIPTGPISHQ